MSLARFAFQACLIDRSSISPFRIKQLRTVLNSLAQTAPSNPRHLLCDLGSSVYGPADPASSWKLCQTSECRSLTYGDSISLPTVQMHLDASATRSCREALSLDGFQRPCVHDRKRGTVRVDVRSPPSRRPPSTDVSVLNGVYRATPGATGTSSAANGRSMTKMQPFPAMF